MILKPEFRVAQTILNATIDVYVYMYNLFFSKHLAINIKYHNLASQTDK